MRFSLSSCINDETRKLKMSHRAPCLTAISHNTETRGGKNLV